MGLCGKEVWGALCSSCLPPGPACLVWRRASPCTVGEEAWGDPMWPCTIGRGLWVARELSPKLLPATYPYSGSYADSSVGSSLPEPKSSRQGSIQETRPYTPPVGSSGHWFAGAAPSWRIPEDPLSLAIVSQEQGDSQKRPRVVCVPVASSSKPSHSGSHLPPQALEGHRICAPQRQFLGCL